MPEFQLYIEKPEQIGIENESIRMLEELRVVLILVVEDVDEISDGIERLLKTDGYRVALARDELHAIPGLQISMRV